MGASNITPFTCPIKCFVINLARANDRRLAFTKHLDELGINYEIFPAIDGLSLNEQEVNHCNLNPYTTLNLAFGRKVIMENPLSKGELGCALSHLHVYKLILEQNLPYACILEDDCLVKRPFLDALQNIASLDFSWDIVSFAQNSSLRNWRWNKKIYLNTDKSQYLQQAGLLYSGFNSLLNARRMIYGSFMYVISANACQHLLKIGYPARVPSDILIGHIAFNRLNIWQVFPKASFYASFDDFSTLIENRPKHDLRVNKIL